MTHTGKVVPVKRVGVQSVLTLFKPAKRLALIRIDAGALAPNVPIKDLTVTADHALLVDDILIHAGALVNGSTIHVLTRDACGDHYTVYNVETDAHEILLANGAPAETFIDNYAEYQKLYGDDAPMVELDLPLAMTARQVPPAIRARLGLVDAA